MYCFDTYNIGIEVTIYFFDNIRFIRATVNVGSAV